MSARSWSSTTRGWRAGARARILEGAGYEVVEAEDGLAALERYFVEKPDVVLLDLVMKGCTGSTCSTKLREIDPAARVDRRLRRHPDLVARDGRRRRRRGLPQQAGRRAEQMLDALVTAIVDWRHPMELTTLQQDALVELLNIGFGRAAASLSQLTGHRVAARSAAGRRCIRSTS